jgi:dihydroflavonol-4-reductase
MKVLVTGATGFLGSNLVHHLVEQGEDVRILKRPSTPPVLIGDLPLETAEGDVTDRESVERAVRGVEGIYHVAGVVSYWRPMQKQQWQVNVVGTRNVVESAARAGVRRIVHTSSVMALGARGDGQLSDEGTQWDGEPYGKGYCRTKYVGEQEALGGLEQGIEVVIVNPGLVFGQRDLHLTGTGIFAIVGLRSVVPCLSGWITTCDVDDVCAGHIAAMRVGRCGQRYVLGGEVRSYRDLISDVGEAMGREVRVRMVPSPVAQMAAHAAEGISRMTRKQPPITPEMMWIAACRRAYTSKRAIAELGYPQTPLRVSLERAYRWYREHSPQSENAPARW